MSYELSLTAMSTGRALRLASALVAGTTGRPAKKISGKLISTLAGIMPEDPERQESYADRLFVINRSMFSAFRCPDGFGVGPDDEISLGELRRHGVKSFTLRCNSDRDLVTVKL